MMTKIVVAVLISMFSCAGALADTITLDSSETLSTPTSEKMDWYISKINAKDKILIVTYRWIDSTGAPILLGTRTPWNQWSCRDVPTPGVNAECVSSEDPWPCCTGSGTGTCDGLDDSCFSDVFGFTIRSQDVGTSLGAGIRTLLWNKFRADVLSGGNNGSFE